MAIILNSAATNNADWKTQFEFTDSETGEDIDFTGASIEVEVRDFDGCARIVASTDNGKVAITGTGIFELTVPASEMSALAPGTYKVGGVYQLNDELISLFTGTLTIIDGVARL
ncbi:hypothetical protein [Rhodopseudomonas sp. B29]|uniref:hypothetical protein n=1 Tax=Rhodopseudomonas sp. B29 TaxID=95607 RepID=UPI000344DBA3|nr:hypothetical protein [Rhodopseudomonas sp. B29]